MARSTEVETCANGHERTPENTYIYPNGRYRACRDCRPGHQRRWRRANPEKCREGERRRRQKDPWSHYVNTRRATLKHRYGLSEQDFTALLRSQGQACPICTEPLAFGASHVDHDHTCCGNPPTCGSCVRGILCGPCNTALGHCDDDPSRAKHNRFTDPVLATRATAYVQSHRPTLVGVA